MSERASTKGRDDELASASRLPELTDVEWCVLGTIASADAEYGWWAYNFKGLARITGKPIDDVKAACRSLRTKGLARVERGLMSEDGEVAGSGYTATQEGNHLYWNREEARPNPLSEGRERS